MRSPLLPGPARQPDPRRRAGGLLPRPAQRGHRHVQNFAFLTGHVQNTLVSFLVFGIGLLVVSVVGFGIYFRRKRWL